MALKPKLVEVNGKSYIETQDGKPVYVDDSTNTESAIDVNNTVETIKARNAEAQRNRLRAEEAEGKLKAFDGIEDPEAARTALGTVKNLSAGELKTAAQVEEIKQNAIKAANEQVATAQRTSAERQKQLEKERDDAKKMFKDEKIGGGFARSKFLAEKLTIPPDMAQATFGKAFDLDENGKVFAIGPDGNKIGSVSRPGEYADFDEAFEKLVDMYPNKNQIMAGNKSSGSGAPHNRGNGNGNGAVMSRREYDGLSIAQQGPIMAKVAKGELRIQD